MKNIFKKNQIIITALAIMIAIAGYLSFTNNDKPDDKGQIQTMDPNLQGYDALSQTDDGTDVAAGTTTGTASGTTNTDVTTGTQNTTTAGTTDTSTNNSTNKTNTTNTTNTTTTPVDTSTKELGDNSDISDQDILQTAQNVADNGELEQNTEGVPGEAVLASTTLDSGFFSSEKLKREQTRAMNKESLMDIINSTTLSEDAKKDATQKLIDMTSTVEKEDAAELLLEAKGFDGAIVSIVNGEADVVINAPNITDQQRAIIEDVVKRKAEVTVDHISINPVVITE
ncbi:MAG TPA: SpoIIIAH-like family protein [Mobilitalea sp.]|nr:SpoIIIAH-like family protein [Mobilitalea sp.]